MWSVLPAALRWALNSELVKPLVGRTLRPATRLAVGLLAVPAFRWVLRAVKLQHFDRELEKDLEEWFAASALLFLCTANAEVLIFQQLGFEPRDWLSLGFRLLLAVGVVEAMPDAQLFPVLHPKPELPKREDFGRGKRWWGVRDVLPGYARGHMNQWLARSSPVFAILACVVGGKTLAGGAIDNADGAWTAGWVCYGCAVSQYLVMGLMASKEDAAAALAAYDARAAAVRAELVSELGHGAACPLPPRSQAPPAKPGDRDPPPSRRRQTAPPPAGKVRAAAGPKG